VDTDNALQQHRWSLVYGLVAVLLWSTMATAFKWSLNYNTPLQLIALASVVSWLFFLVALGITGELKILKSTSSGEITRSLLFGLLNPGIYYLVLFEAYDRLPAQDAMAINYTWGLTLPLISALFTRQWPSGRALALALLSYLGILVIATDGRLMALEFEHPMGVGLALLSTVLWGLAWSLNSLQKLEAIPALFLNFTAAIPVLWIVMWLDGSMASLTWQSLAAGVYVGLFEMGIAFLLWLNALRMTQNTLQLSSLIFLAPVISLLLIATVLGEAISVATLIGLGLILVGLAAQQLRSDAN
jgi:drug/metabolite transporter (DMT)-like permease